MVPADSSRISPVPPYSGYPNSCKPYQYRTITFYGPTFQLCSHSVYIHISGPTTPYRYFGTVWAPPLSLATTHGIIIIFYSSGYLDVSVPRVTLPLNGISRLHLDGLPHSDIPGSRVVCTSPGLFAAYHVLRLLQEPRHPPYALLSFLALQSFVCQNKYFFPNLLYLLLDFFL